MKKIKRKPQNRIFYVVHFDHDEYLKLFNNDSFILTTSFLKAKRFEDVYKATTTAQKIIEEFEPEDIGYILSIVQVTISSTNSLATVLRRVKSIPF